jgi:hypothetical protein
MRALLREGLSPPAARKNCIRHFALLKRQLLPSLDKIIEDSLLPLGTRVLWINDWTELTERLRLLYESTGNKWSAVS